MKPKSRLPNGSRAIMADRKDRGDVVDFYPTPPWATRALCEVILPKFIRAVGRQFSSAWEPAAGEGHMSEVLREYFGTVFATDKFYAGVSEDQRDFLEPAAPIDIDWIITNPPYYAAERFCLRAIEQARVGVAMFTRVQILESIGRYENLFKPHPPTLVAMFSERVPLCKGRWAPDGTTATAYCWLVWVKGTEPMAPFWIPPNQRKLLTKPDDRARFAAWSLIREAAE